jgi:hypothetical protein
MFLPGILNAVRQAAVARGYGVHGGNSSSRVALARAPARIVANMVDSAELPTLFIDIKFRNLQTLYAKRQQALNAGFLIQGDDDFVPASIRLAQQTIPVELRLKGDMLDHVRGDKWSFRIHTKGVGQLFGLRRFSVQHPGTRGYQAELLFLETLQSLGVLAPRYLFVRVVVNGNSVGVMALEEHGSKELLERNGRKDGVIIRFDESLLWESRMAKGEGAPRLGGPFESYLVAPIDAFEMSKIEKSPQLTRELDVAAGLLRAFVESELPASEVFDVELLGRFLATAELWGAWHAIVWPNLRFYLNPLTMRLEPIGFDASIELDPAEGSVSSPESLMGQMLADREVRAAFDRTLQTLKDSVENGEFIDQLRQLERPALRDLRTEYFLLEEMDLETLVRRAHALPYTTTAAEGPGPYPVNVVAQLITDGQRQYLELANPLPHAVQVQALDWVDDKGRVWPFEAASKLSLPLVLASTPLDTRPIPLRVDYQASVAAPNDWLRVTARIGTDGEQKFARASRGFAALRKPPLPTGDIRSQLARHPFLSLDSKAQRAEIRKGRWTVRESLEIPPGLTLLIHAGTTLRFSADASLIVHGATDMLGTTEEPVVLEAASDHGGNEGTWQGIAVFNAPARSHWSHVMVRDTTGVSRGAWSLTGGITFYHSDVTMTDCVLEGNRAEDATNIVHSDFALDNLTVFNTASDGLDSDFSTGSVRGGLFRKIGTSGGADAIDVSGSTVVVDGTRFTDISDKALSVGEDSSMTARNVVAENCGVGAASKDGSTLELADSVFRGARIAGLMSYVKKPEYGPSSLVSTNVQVLGSARHAVAQQGTTLILDGKQLPGQSLDVDQLYRTVMTRGLRR